MKILALVLALCMMTMAFPVFAETTEEPADSGLLSQLSGILGGDGSLEEKISGLIEKLSKLKESFTGSDSQFSAIVSSLSEKLQSLLQPGEEGIGSLLSGLKDQLSGIGNIDLSGLLGGLTGGEESKDLDLSGLLGGLTGSEGGKDLDLSGLLGTSNDAGDAETEDDGETLGETLEKLNQEAEADNGENVPKKKAAESVEEFYGTWTETKFTFQGDEYDASEFSEGAFIGENTFYLTRNGVKAEDFLFSEHVEMFIREGVLKTKSDEGHWSTFVLTEDGEIVMSSSSLLTYYVRAGE